MAIMRIVKNNNFSIVSNAIIGDKMSRKVGTKCPEKRGQNVPQLWDKMSPKNLKGAGQNVECKSDTVRKK